MKNLIFIATVFLSSNLFAATGYEQLEQMFKSAKTLDVAHLKSSRQGMYVGRCFGYKSNYPMGAFSAFTDYSKDSGPIKVDPEMYVAWGANNESNYFDWANVEIVLRQARQIKIEIIRDDISYEYNQPYNWVIQFRQNADYIVQRNMENGIDHSYCYYYQFRNR